MIICNREGKVFTTLTEAANETEIVVLKDNIVLCHAIKVNNHFMCNGPILSSNAFTLLNKINAKVKEMTRKFRNL